MARVLITSLFLKPGDEVDRLLTAAGLDTHHAPLDGPRSETELITLLDGVSGVIAASDPFTERVLGSAPSLRVVARTGVGYDAIDVAAATRLGIAVCNTPGINRQAVAEHTFALMLAFARRLPEVLADVARGGWTRPSGTELAGATLGVVGLGAIGTSVARIASGFGMRTLGYDPFVDAARAAEWGVELADLDTLLGAADFVSLHLGLSDATRHLIDAERISRMKPGAVLVNTSRGGIVDEQALVRALEARTIAGAALDVVDQEPVPAEHPLRTLPNVILTPHIGGATFEARRRSGLGAAEALLDVLHGRSPASLLNPDTLVTANIVANGR